MMPMRRNPRKTQLRRKRCVCELKYVASIRTKAVQLVHVKHAQSRCVWQANGRRGGSRASKRKASKALGGDVSDDGDDGNEGSDYDWEADHQDVDWTNHPAECILALTMKGKYVVKRKGIAHGLTVGSCDACVQCNLLSM